MPIFNAPILKIDAAETRRYASLKNAQNFDEKNIAEVDAAEIRHYAGLKIVQNFDENISDVEAARNF